MGLIKHKISKEELIDTVYQLGLSRYHFLQIQFNNQFKYQDTLLFILSMITTSFLAKRILKFQNIKIQFDIVDEVNKIVCFAFQNENDKLIYIQYYLTLKDEIWNIINNDQSHLVFDLADYFINEITENKNQDDIPRRYMVDILSQWHFETKKYLKNIKIK